jgi:hypothetical protein
MCTSKRLSSFRKHNAVRWNLVGMLVYYIVIEQ